jgi:hypothetical protein
VRKWPFEKITFALDPSHSYPTSATFDPNPQVLAYPHRKVLLLALATFRGTLIDGVLQPNVRLENGLNLSTSLTLNLKTTALNRESFVTTKEEACTAKNHAHGIQDHRPTRSHIGSRKTRNEEARLGKRRDVRDSSQNKKVSVQNSSINEREAELNKRQQQLLLLQQQLLMQSMTPMSKETLAQRYSNSRQRSDASHPHDGRFGYGQPTRSTPSISDFELRERELHHREELLRWKHKNFVLQQQLAIARGRDPAELAELEDSTRVSSPPKSGVPTESFQATLDDSTSEPEWDDFAGLNVPSPNPSRRAGQRRTRIKLPRRS